MTGTLNLQKCGRGGGGCGCGGGAGKDRGVRTGLVVGRAAVAVVAAVAAVLGTFRSRLIMTMTRPHNITRSHGPYRP